MPTPDYDARRRARIELRDAERARRREEFQKRNQGAPRVQRPSQAERAAAQDARQRKIREDRIRRREAFDKRNAEGQAKLPPEREPLHFTNKEAPAPLNKDLGPTSTTKRRRPKARPEPEQPAAGDPGELELEGDAGAEGSAEGSAEGETPTGEGDAA